MRPERVADKRWWQRKDKPHETVYSIARRLAKENPRKALYKQLRALYSDDWGEGTPLAAIAGLGTGPCHRDNVIANAVDAVHSRLAKNRPRPWVVTVGGDWSLQQKAKKSSQWLAGEFERLDTYKLG